ncbi:uncharacterized protein JCM6883_000540 [Sporobolomyces salmoneus]|uniref:uncharacterized protein n=1 Tax=Sporobolomyces salmoneus TaxID=183962 RepID=UPI003181D33C
MDIQSLQRAVDRYLQDSTDPIPLTDAFTSLTSSPEPATSLLLYSTVHHLLISLFSTSPIVSSLPNQLFTLFHASIFPALEGRPTESEDKARLGDTILDVVWQIDQEVESGALEFRQAGGVFDTKKLMDLVQAGRKRIAQFLKSLVNGGDVSKEAALERLDMTIISELDFIQDARFFGRLEVRQRTALFYKQQKFNLLREESEGYAKLVVELLGNMGPPHDVMTAKSRETEQERTRRAVSVNDKVKSLIGNFDLDPTRTLDIFLDTFSDQIVEHYQFFLDFLSVSPWAPKSKRHRSTTTANGSDEKGKQKELQVDLDLEKDEGSDTLAQILGFKFGYYQASLSVGSGEVPQNLYLMAAVLIWHGFVKLSDLWNHLSPSDADLSKIDSKYRDEQAQLARSVGGANALAMAGALVDDEAPSSAAKGAATTSSNPTASSSKTAPGTSSTTIPAEDLPNQKIGLLKALLVVGDITHSLFILTQWPILVHAFPEIADLLNRLLSVSLDPAYDSISISRQHSQWAEEFRSEKSRSILDSKGEKKVLIPEIKRMITGEAFPDPRGNWTFFFPGWKERTPKAGDIEEALTVLEKTFMSFIGVFISRDFTLLTKICRLIKKDLTSDSTRPRESRWLDIIRIHLLPSISLLHTHSVSSLEIWDVLSLFPIEKRFELYGEWKDVWYRKIPVLTVRKAEAEKEVKSILRRLSTENVKKLGKTLAKVAHTNPTVIWSVALNQVMSYDNLILPVIDAARYLTDLGYDVLAYCVLDALSGTRNKTKEDGTSVAMWLSGIASFTGQLYRRWANMATSLPVILQYLVNQLVTGNSKDLIVLRELISRMTAIEPFADLSDAQVLSLAGGRYLRNEVFQQTEISQAGKRMQMSQLANARIRLQNSLFSQKDKSLAMPLLVNIALQRQACLKNTEAHLKSLGALFDQNHAILFQYTELLAALTEPDQLAELLPSVPTLITTFHLTPSIAFDLARPKLRLAMRHFDDKEAAEQEAKRKKGLLEKLQREKKAATNSQSSSQASSLEEGETKTSKIDTVVVDGEDVKMEDVKVEDVKMEDLEAAASNALIDTNGEETPRAATPVVGSPWHPGLVDLVEKMNEILPEEARSGLGSAFFVTFWQMTLYDLIYPKERYDAEVSRLKGLQREAATNLSLQATDRDTFIAKIIDLATKLMAEMGRHFSASRGATRRLEKEKDHWFTNVQSRDDRNRLVQDILQYCIEPRARLSLPDAVFAYQIVRRLHSMNTAGFHTIVFFDQLLTTQVSPTLFSCTENEARNYGRFLYDVLADLAKWYKDETAYKAEAIGSDLRGFARFFSPPESKKTLEHYSHADIQKAINKWHASMLHGFQESFRSGEYMHIKNSILVLTKIAPYFPLDYSHGQHISHSVEELIAAETREDLKILAQGYQAVISKRKKHWFNAPSSAPSRAPSQPLASDSPTPISSPIPTLTTGKSSIPAKPSTLSSSSTATSSSLPTGPSRSTPSGQAASSSSSSSVPTGPKGLPVKPGTNSSSSASRSIPTVAPETPSIPSGPSAASNRSSLPIRPGGAPRSSLTREDSSSSSTTTTTTTTEKLRQQALASRQANESTINSSSTTTTTAKSMDPPPTPSAASSGSASATNGRTLPSKPDPSPRTGTGGSRASSPRREESRRERDRDSQKERDTRDRERGDRDRESTTREKERESGGGESRSSRRSSRERGGEREKDKARERSVDSTHSSSRRGGGGGDERDSKGDRRERDRDRGERSERSSRDKESRSSRDDREKERERDRDRGDRGDRDERGSSSRRTSDRYGESGSSSRSSSRREKEESEPQASSASSSRRPVETFAARRAREAEERLKAAKEKEKERQRESDRLREEQRARDAEEAGEKERSRRNGSSRRDEPSSSRNGLPDKPGQSSSSSSKPTPSGPAGDRLRPAPASRTTPSSSSSERAPPTGPSSGFPARSTPTNVTSSPNLPTGPAAARSSNPPTPTSSEPAAAPPGPVNMIVKGRGRLYDSLVSDGGGSGKRRTEEESGKKRAAPTGPLADRLGPEEKRARTEGGSSSTIRGGRGSDSRDRGR